MSARTASKNHRNLKLASVKTKNSKKGNSIDASSYMKPRKPRIEKVKANGITSVDENGKSKSVNADWKRKRFYADYDTGGGRTLHNNAEPRNKSTRNKLKADFGKGQRTVKERAEKNYSIDKKGHKIFRGRAKGVDKDEIVEGDGDGNKISRKSVNSKSSWSKQLGQNQNKHIAESLGNPAKKKIQNKKSLADDSESTIDRPKKKKRRIRIDPYDISNKRLDDGMVTNENTKEKTEEEEKVKNVEMSKNAEFRAIKPSPSILSFVEDNLLGRRRDIELRRAGYNTDLSAPLDNIPFSTSLERERIEETVFRNNLTFFAAAKISSSLPPPDLPEIAFAGRSNVGKSSLLNALTRQWGVVRTSDKPGLTQTINFFKLASKLCLVDLPGYGFAYAKEEVKESWEELVKEYVSTRVGLKRVCLLVDTKWGMKPRDYELIDLMERSQTKYQIVLTKTDLVFPIDVARRAMQIEESLKVKKSAVQPVMMASSKSGAGIRSLRTVLAKIARFVKV